MDPFERDRAVRPFDIGLLLAWGCTRRIAALDALYHSERAPEQKLRFGGPGFGRNLGSESLWDTQLPRA
jgi:hypothetical protein